MRQQRVEDKMNRFSYVLKWDDAVLEDLKEDDAMICVCLNPARGDQNRKGFSAVMMVRGQQLGMEVSGVTTEKGFNRGHLRAFVILLKELAAHVKEFRAKVYVNNLYLWKFLTRDWGFRWMNNGYMKNDGTTVRNKDLIKPMAEYLYLNHLKDMMLEIYDYREFGDYTNYSLKRALTQANQVARDYANAM